MDDTRSARSSSDGRISTSALFSYGFRPFFLGAAIYAVLAMALWLLWLGTQDPSWATSRGSPIAWHAHEMVFGFGLAAVGGFLLTAVPNWTGALPLSGRPLVLLFLTWVAGRISMNVEAILPGGVVAAIDLAFVPLLGVFAARQLFVKPAARNLVFLVLLAALTGGNAAYHLAAGGLISSGELEGVRFALVILVLTITIVGGRIVPAFTHNWLHLNAPGSPMPQRYAQLDAVAVGSAALFAAIQTVPAPEWLTGIIALAAALANGVRLALWRGLAARRAPIVWVLHLGYAWVVVGFLMAGAAALSGLVPGSAASHAFGTGAVGTMVMAVTTRASLGHTGRALVAPRPIVWAYALVTLAALLRMVGVVLAPDMYASVLTAAGLAWIGAFSLFVAVFAPILLTPRIASKVTRPVS
jgi:uncharacterized protein involved in response to NO